MLLTNFNFAQPLWLFGLVLIPLGWLWNKYWRHTKTMFGGLDKFIDARLIPHVLTSGQQKLPRKKLGLIYTALAISIIIALANPRWSYKEFDSFQPTASMVVLLDLSANMNADDVSPSRITRARQIIEDLLDLSQKLKIGLIGFAGNPHLISPITDDIQTIKTYISALDTDLINMQGNGLTPSLRMAAELLTREPGEKKSILLLSSGNFVANNIYEQVSKLNSAKIAVHVIGIGTEVGAPYIDNNGILHKVKGHTVTSKLNVALLQEIAKQGHGIYTEITANDKGLHAILRKAEQTPSNTHLAAGKIRQWDDQYYWFVLIAAGLFLYLVQQRVLYVAVLAIYFGLNSNPVQALTWRELFVNTNMRGQEAYVNGNFNDAAQIFTDPYKKGVALYRDGQFAQAELEFNQVQNKQLQTSAIYNAGNAQMQQRKWEAAIDSYEAVLAEEPDNFPAQHNLEIARKMLAKEDKKEQDPDCECKNPKKGKGKQKQNQSKQNQDQQKQDQSKQNQDQQKQDQSKQNQDRQKQDQKNQAEQDKKEQDTKNAANDKKQQQQENSQKQEPQATKEAQAEQARSEAKENKDPSQDKPAQTMQYINYDKAQVDQLLNRVDGDIKVFLKNKFYIEDILSAQDK